MRQRQRSLRAQVIKN